MLLRKHLVAVLACVFAAGGWAQAPAPAKGPADLLLLLDKSGHKYSKIDDNVWEIVYEGKNMKNISVRVTMTSEVMVTLAKVADRKDLKLDPALLTKALELNNDFDYVKLALTDSMLYVRMDTPLRLLDGAELNHALAQVSAAADETYPVVKPFLTGGQ